MEEIIWIPLPQMPPSSRNDILVFLNKSGCWMGRFEGGCWDLYYSDQGLSSALVDHVKLITHWALLPKGPTQ